MAARISAHHDQERHDDARAEAGPLAARGSGGLASNFRANAGDRARETSARGLPPFGRRGGIGRNGSTGFHNGSESSAVAIPVALPRRRGFSSHRKGSKRGFDMRLSVHRA